MSNIKETKTGYSSNADNYVYTEANDDISVDELTVTITLNEYRKLVTDRATMNAQIDKAEKNKWARESENDRLKQENEQMKAEMFDLKKKLEEFEKNAASMQQTSEYFRTQNMAIEAIQNEDREDYELATEQMEHDAMYEPTYNSEDGSM